MTILAKDAVTGARVAIENLYGWTDIDHLGRLFIYATGCNAPVSILIAEEFVHEHAQTLHQMNEWTKEEVKFFGVKVEAIKKTTDSRPEARFRKVVYPGGWDKAEMVRADAVPPHVQKYNDFFEPLILQLIRLGFNDKPVKRFFHGDRLFASLINPGWGYSVSLEGKNDAWASVHIETGDKGIDKEDFR